MLLWLECHDMAMPSVLKTRAVLPLVILEAEPLDLAHRVDVEATGHVDVGLVGRYGCLEVESRTAHGEDELPLFLAGVEALHGGEDGLAVEASKCIDIRIMRYHRVPCARNLHIWKLFPDALFEIEPFYLLQIVLMRAAISAGDIDYPVVTEANGQVLARDLHEAENQRFPRLEENNLASLEDLRAVVAAKNVDVIVDFDRSEVVLGAGQAQARLFDLAFHDIHFQTALQR
jgi:hypothetical protein